MSRYKLVIEYDGMRFCGWQRQASDAQACAVLAAYFDGIHRRKLAAPPQVRLSVQGLLEFALERILHAPMLLEGAGRTDTGVHALAQCAHFDSEAPVEVDRLRAGLNYYAQPFGAAVLELAETAPDFHARFSALRRFYAYHIYNRAAPLILARERAWHVTPPLDIGLMRKAAGAFEGFHDFSAFRAAECQGKSPWKTVDHIEISPDAEQIIIRVSARSFLHNQVRIMVGTLVQVGKGKMPVGRVAQLLDTGDRTQAGPTAPPYGLYLTGVKY